MAVLDELTRPAGDEDTVCGVRAHLVAAPRDTAEAAALIAASRGRTVVVRGAGTKLDWGPLPERLDLIIDTRRLTGVVEHAAGDLIVVVRAGTPLAGIDLGDQLLALDGPAGATVGGTVATATTGPRRMHYGAPRDLLIGITVVRPDGRIAHSGGKVVKNVAGYDLGKLYTGSYGTLGLITECVFRLHPRPASAAYVCAPAPASAAAAVLAAQVVPTAVELDSATGELAVLLEGTPDGVRDRAAAVAALIGGTPSAEPPPWWGVPPWSDGGPPIGMRLSVPISAVPALVGAATAVRDSPGTPTAVPDSPGTPTAVRGSAVAVTAVRGSAGTGVLLAAVDDITEVERLRAECTRRGGHAVVLIAPPEVRDTLDMWGPVPGLALMRRVKQQFDPDRRFAPGRFVGGI